MILQSDEQGAVIGPPVVKQAVVQAIKKWNESNDN